MTLGYQLRPKVTITDEGFVAGISVETGDGDGHRDGDGDARWR